jgi:DNA-binding transcriptional ArsR family regulator
MAVEPRAKRAPVLDVGRPDAVAVEVDASEAADVLMSLFAVCASRGDDTFDAGRDRLAAVRTAVDPGLLEQIEDLMQGNEKVPAHLLGLVWETPRPRTLPALVERIRATDPLQVHLHLLGYYAGGHRHVPAESSLAAARGDEAAIEEVVAALAEWPQTCRTVEHLLRLGPATVKERVLEVLPRWHEEVYLPNAAGIAEALERDAAAKRELARTSTPEQLTELATSGYQYAPAPGIRRLVFFPGWWQRPWVLLNEYRHVKVFCYPLPLEGGGDGPSPAELARRYKALGDEGRLRLLKRLSDGPLTLAAAAQELGVAKSTAHHHLALLRHAGFVMMRDEGDDKLYNLRRELVPESGALLQTYLG